MKKRLLKKWLKASLKEDSDYGKYAKGRVSIYFYTIDSLIGRVNRLMCNVTDLL